jgi:hypothetical protein
MWYRQLEGNLGSFSGNAAALYCDPTRLRPPPRLRFYFGFVHIASVPLTVLLAALKTSGSVMADASWSLVFVPAWLHGAQWLMLAAAPSSWLLEHWVVGTTAGARPYRQLFVVREYHATLCLW